MQGDPNTPVCQMVLKCLPYLELDWRSPPHSIPGTRPSRNKVLVVSPWRRRRIPDDWENRSDVINRFVLGKEGEKWPACTIHPDVGASALWSDSRSAVLDGQTRTPLRIYPFISSPGRCRWTAAALNHKTVFCISQESYCRLFALCSDSTIWWHSRELVFESGPSAHSEILLPR